MMITLVSLAASAAPTVAAGYALGLVRGRRAARAADCRGCLTDPLTGRFNRRAVKAAMLAYGLGREPLGAIMIDLDQFKPVNDTFGHEVGDRVLIEVGRRLDALVPDRGVVGRLGGDEFVVLALGDVDQVRRLAKAVHRELTAPIEIGGLTLELGASVGLVHVQPEQAGCALQAADRAMYRAKLAGGGVAEHIDDAKVDDDASRPQVRLRDMRGFETTSLGEVRTA